MNTATLAHRTRSAQREWPLAALVVGSIFEMRLRRAPSVTISEIISVFVGFQLLADWVVGGARLEERTTARLGKIQPVLVFGMWMIVCAFLAVAVRANPLNIWLVRDHVPLFLMLFTLCVYGVTPEQIERLLKIYLFCSLIMLGLGAIQAATGGPQFVEANWATDAKMDIDGKIITGANKARGIFTHPNGYASFLLLPLALMFARLRRRPIISVSWILCVITMLVTLGVLYATHAKGAWAWAAIIAFLIFFIPNQALKWRWLPLAIGTAFSMALLFGSLYLFEQGHRSFATMLTRVRLWRAAWVVSAPDAYVWLFGNGQLTMPETSWRYSDIQYPNAHSGLVNIPLQYGVPGGVAFVSMFISAYLSACRALAVQTYRRTAWMLLGLLTAYFWNALFEPHLEGGGNLLQFGACLTLCYAIGLLADNERAWRK